jgi:hypothetical protein
LLLLNLTPGVKVDIRDSFKEAFLISGLSDSLNALEVQLCVINSQPLPQYAFRLLS